MSEPHIVAASLSANMLLLLLRATFTICGLVGHRPLGRRSDGGAGRGRHGGRERRRGASAVVADELRVTLNDCQFARPHSEFDVSA